VRRERIRQNQERAEERRLQRRQRDYIRIHPRDAGPSARERQRMQVREFAFHGTFPNMTEQDWISMQSRINRYRK
jgi:hypothetical protein